MPPPFPVTRSRRLRTLPGAFLIAGLGLVLAACGCTAPATNDQPLDGLRLFGQEEEQRQPQTPQQWMSQPRPEH